MVGDMRDVLLSVYKEGKKPWQDMKEQEQKDLVERITNRCLTAATKAVDIIASEGRPHVKVILTQLTMKDGIKGSFETVKSAELRHELFDAQGDTVLIVVNDTQKYTGARGKVKYDKDQPDLPAMKQETSNGATEETHNPETGEVTEASGQEEPRPARADIDG